MDKPAKNEEPLGLDHGLPTTARDVAALHYLPMPRLSMDEYVAWLETLPQPTYEQLRNLPISIGEPFRL
jgi:hypothetical protein